MTFEQDGAEQRAGAAVPILPALLAMAERLPITGAGVRLNDVSALTVLLEAGGVLTSLARDVLGDATRPVRAILF